jgi:predicted transposase/invertase (TIGR01784 family)
MIEILEGESNQNSLDDKFNRIDLKVKNQNDEIILIEIQYSTEFDYLQRILYATSKAIGEHLKQGEPYSDILKVISISILYFDFGDGDDYIYKGMFSPTNLWLGLSLNNNGILSNFSKSTLKGLLNFKDFNFF